MNYRQAASVSLMIWLCCAPANGADITSQWISATNGDWDDASKWTSSSFSRNGGQTYEAIVDAAGTAFAVNLDTDITISDFTLNSNDATVDHVNSEFRVLNSTDLIAGRFNVKGGVIVGGIWNLAEGVLKFNNNSNNRISGVTLQGALDLDTSSAFVRLQNGAVFTGDANVSGSSAVLAIEQTTDVGQQDYQRDRVQRNAGGKRRAYADG